MLLGVAVNWWQPAVGPSPGRPRIGGLPTVSGRLPAVLHFPGNREADGDTYSNGTEAYRHCFSDGYASPLAYGRYGS